ncbi:hypothetical protein KP77_25550 [Jeotgalibacillus alimentarius]|uniref:Uncharacterized protein n=1 Tax=Jeotgalibacillus alimentarius TaxID=135826 RepID=A0A0C2VR23_9BACL|nr:hypothetical protein [Jeotgalibacillus alimentarius]KIL46428.1 hypothetical protein KP77_25550 [Jeotgalibacillus alimentarius]
MPENKTDQIFKLRGYLHDYINSASLQIFLKDQGVNNDGLKPGMISALEDAVNEDEISDSDLYLFLDKEIRFGRHRTIFIKDIAESDISTLKTMSEDEIKSIIINKGFAIPNNNILSVELPDTTTLAEVIIEPGSRIYLTFIETVKVLKTETVSRENNFYFVEIDLENSRFSVRLYPRSKQINSRNKIVPYSIHFFNIERTLKRIFGFSTIQTTHYKNTLYDIANDFTQKAEQKWVNKVNAHDKALDDFTDMMLTKLPDIKPSEFNLRNKLQKLLERALIQSNFDDLKQQHSKKKGYLRKFNFSDSTGGVVNASSQERERSIDLSEIYYDTKDTIDQLKKYDKVWVYWFTDGEPIENRLEANDDYLEIHFFKHISQEDLFYVLSEIKDFISSS